MPDPNPPFALRSFDRQPRIHLASEEIGDRSDLAVKRLSGTHALDLAVPVHSTDSSGEPVRLPGAMPRRTAAAETVASIAGGVVAVSPAPHRTYLMTDRGELVLDQLGSSPNILRRAHRDWKAIQELTRELASSPSAVCLAAGQRTGYWHWWIDVISRVWSQKHRGSEMAFAFPPPTAPFQAETLALLGIQKDVITIKPGLHQFDAVSINAGITPGSSRFPTPSAAEFAKWLRAEIGPGQTGDRSRRLFVSRDDATTRRVANEKDLSRLFQERDIEVIRCGDLPLRKQLAAFSEASLVIGPHGSALTNLLFSRTGTKVIELFSSAAALDVSNYRVLASHLGHPYARVVGRTAPHGGRVHAHGLDMEIDPGHLARALDAVEGSRP